MWSLASRSPRSMRLDSSTSSSRVSSGVAAMPSRNCWRESRVGSGAGSAVRVSVLTRANLRPRLKRELNTEKAANDASCGPWAVQRGQVAGARNYHALGLRDLARQPLGDLVEVALVQLADAHERAGRDRREVDR